MLSRSGIVQKGTSLKYAIRNVYESLGYELIEVPKMPVKTRCEFLPDAEIIVFGSQIHGTAKP